MTEAAYADGAGPERIVGPVSFRGRLDAFAAVGLRTELDAALAATVAADGHRLVLDLGEVSFVDSAGLAALVRLRRECAAARVELRLVRPREEDAMRVFRLTQLDRVFVFVPGGTDAQ